MQPTWQDEIAEALRLTCDLQELARDQRPEEMTQYLDRREELFRALGSRKNNGEMPSGALKELESADQKLVEEVNLASGRLEAALGALSAARGELPFGEERLPPHLLDRRV